MKRVFLSSVIVFSALYLAAAVHNPYVNQCSVNPMLPWQLGGSGMVSFVVGNSGSNAMPLVRNQAMKLMVTLSNGMPDVVPMNAGTAVMAIGGTWAGMFDWTFNVMTNTYTGVQNQTIPAQGSGTVTIQYRVSENSLPSEPSNGVNVNIVPPAYSNGANSTADDAVSSYTYAVASDYGDAPSVYGSASHFINVEDPSNTVYLGELLDYETGDQFSDAAYSDDMTGVDDEDGVAIPDLVQGTVVTIPVKVTVKGTAFGYLCAWMDWNGDGDFNDPGEEIASNVIVLNTGTVNLSVFVPVDAVISGPTYARFRIGPENMGSSGSYPFGEVEDYQVQVAKSPVGIGDKTEKHDLLIYSFENDIYVKDLAGSGLRGSMAVYNMIGQRVAKKALTGGTLNKFSMNVEEGYYVVEVTEENGTARGKVYLLRE